MLCISLFSLTAGFALLAGLVDPRVFWVLSFVSPVLPWILLVLLIFTVILLYQRRFKTALFPLLIVVLARPSLKKALPGEILYGKGVNEIRLVTANTFST